MNNNFDIHILLHRQNNSKAAADKEESLDTHTHTHPFNGPLSRTTQVSLYQKGKTNLDFTEARDSEWQWHQLSHMQVCISLQTDNLARTPVLSFLQAGCPSRCPTNSVKTLKAKALKANDLMAHIYSSQTTVTWLFVFCRPVPTGRLRAHHKTIKRSCQLSVCQENGH